MEDLEGIVKIKLINENGHIPVRATSESAGFDIYSSEDTVIESGEYKAVSTGFSMEMKSGMEAQIRPRSGLAAKHGITVLNSPGTIDSDYRGEVKILLINHSRECFNIKKGERIAQMIFSKVIDVNIIQSENLNSSVRGEGGFGSTGIHKL